MLPRTVALALALLGCLAAQAQTSPGVSPGAPVPATPPPPAQTPAALNLGVASPAKDCGIKTIPTCALHVLQDEKRIVTSPLRIDRDDLLWLVPLAAGTGYTLTQDAGILQDVGHNPTTEKHYNTFSNVAGIYAPAAYSGIAFIASSFTHNEHLRETSMLVTEAGVDALILNTGLQYAVNRQDPRQGSQTGEFWPHGLKGWPNGTSMPSEHAINVWSFARVVAGEYPGWRTKTIVYSMATAVSFSRVMARQHFPSDVIVGSTLGYLIGGLVIHQRAAGMGGISLSSIQTANGKGIQISYSFNH